MTVRHLRQNLPNSFYYEIPVNGLIVSWLLLWIQQSKSHLQSQVRHYLRGCLNSPTSVYSGFSRARSTPIPGTALDSRPAHASYKLVSRSKSSCRDQSAAVSSMKKCSFPDCRYSPHPFSPAQLPSRPACPKYYPFR